MRHKIPGLVNIGIIVFLLLAAPAPAHSQEETCSWDVDQRLTNDPADSMLSYNFAWSIAADDASRVHVVWYDTRDGVSQIYYRHSTDGGTTWQTAVRLSSNAAGQSNPAIAVSGPNVYVVWHDMRNQQLNIFFKRSVDGGNTWQPDIPITTDGMSSNPSIAASDDGVYVVWGSRRDGQAEVYTRHSADS